MKPKKIRIVRSAKEQGGFLSGLRMTFAEKSNAQLAKERDALKLHWPGLSPEKPNSISPPTQPPYGAVSTLFEGQMDLHMPDEERALQREAAVYAGRCPKCGCKPSIIRSADGIYSLHCRFPGRKAGFLDHSCDFPKPEPQKNPHTLIRIWNLSLKLCQG